MAALSLFGRAHLAPYPTQATEYRRPNSGCDDNHSQLYIGGIQIGQSFELAMNAYGS